MTDVIEAPADDPRALASAVLDEEARRHDEQRARDAEGDALSEFVLPPTDEMSFREVVRKGGRSTIAVLFGVVMCDNMVNGGAFQVLAPDIQRSFHLTDGALGIVAALAGFTAFLTALPLGSLGDRGRRTFITGACTLVWAGFAALTGAVHAVWQLVGARVFTGMGQANEQPIHGSLLADAYPPEGRGRIFGLHRAASPIGLLAGAGLAGLIASAVGGPEAWRWAFAILAVPPVLLGIAALFLREPRRGHHEQLAVLGETLAELDEDPVSLGAAFARLKKIKSFYYLMAALGAFGVAVFTVPTYLNLILQHHLGLSAGQRGLAGSITAGGAVIGAAIGGRYSDRLFHKSPILATRFVAVALASLGIGFGLQAYAPNLTAYCAIGAVSQMCLWAGLVPASPIAAAILPYRLRSTGFAVVGLYLSLVGGIGGAVLLGLISDATDERLAVALVAPAASLVAAGLVVFGSRFIPRDMAAAAVDILEEFQERQRLADGGELPMLQVRHLDFSYGPVQVLFDVNLDVRQGEVLALLGTNGAGKSTVLRAISGLSVPDRGLIRLAGRTITLADPATRVRMGVVQVAGGRAVFPTLTVGDNLLAAGYSIVADPELLEQRLAHVLELFPTLADRFHQPAGTLSGGEQQMLGIASGLLLEPKILLIDELSLGLAPVVVQHLLSIIERLKAEGLTMVIVEQSVNVALAVADRAVFMEKGQVRFEGPAAELLERDDLVRAVFLGGEGG